MPSALVNRPGEDVEAVVAMLLCRRFDRAARRRPSRGDRGVDVYVPADDGRVDVYQVKRYDRSLLPGQWSKIRKSFDTLVDAVTQGHIAVRNWYLVLPLDQSDPDETKFAQLVTGAPFELSEWKGLAWLDALASDYPDVIDYYLVDGKARLEEAHRDLMTVLRARDAAEDDGGAHTISDGLGALHRALNRHDPHYSYDFGVSSAANRDALLPAELPDRLVAIAQLSDGETCVTWHVHARCDESLRARPIPLGLQFDLNQDPSLRESLRLFTDYGKPFSAPRAVTITMDLPGGLGGTHENGSVSIGPTAEDAARRYVLRLRATQADGSKSGPVGLAMNAPTVGAKGARLSGEHEGQAFAFEAFHDFDPARMQLRFSTLELTGKPVMSVVGGVEFLGAIAGSKLDVAAEHGPFMPFGEVPATALLEHDGVDFDASRTVRDALQTLAELQEYTSTTLLVPDFAQVTRGEVREWRHVARIVAGETIVDARLGELRTELQEPPNDPPADEHAFGIVNELVLQVGSQHVAFGQQVLYISAARVLKDPDHRERLTVMPLPGAKWTRRRAGTA